MPNSTIQDQYIVRIQHGNADYVEHTSYTGPFDSVALAGLAADRLADHYQLRHFVADGIECEDTYTYVETLMAPPVVG